MAELELLIEKLSESTLNDSYVERIEAIRSSLNPTVLKNLADAGIGQFSENWDTFDDSSAWDNSWDQGAPN
jgi:hypothetical protein